MTNNSVRDGASPRDPKTVRSDPPPADPAPVPAPAKPAPEANDWLAPVEPEPAPATDWLAPAGPLRQPSDFEPEEGEFQDEDLDFEDGDQALDSESQDEDGEGDEPETDEAWVSLVQRLRRISPAVVLLGLAAGVSLGALLAQLASHTSPIPLLTSLAVVTGLIYAAIAIICAVAAYRSASGGEGRVSFLLAFVGGSAAIVACGSFAGATLLVLALGF